jgi:cytochrome c553
MILRITSNEVGRSNWSTRTCGVILTAVVSLVVGATATAAQDVDKVKAGLEAWKNSGCAECHGSFADGDKQRDESPTGANLRTARLNTAALKEVISCGRPGGAGMPAFEEGAYKVRACYGRPLGAPPDNLYPNSTTLTAIMHHAERFLHGWPPATRQRSVRMDRCRSLVLRHVRG